MVLLSIKESSLLHAVKKSRGQKDPRVQQKHCSSVTQSDLKNILNKKCMYLFIHWFILSLDNEASETRRLMTSMGATEDHGPVVTVSPLC